MRFVLIATCLLATSGTALAQTGFTRQQAVDAIDAADDARFDWGDWVDDTEAEIDALPPGPDKTAILVEWSAFVLAWAQKDTAAETQIGLAEDDLASGDAATSPMLKSLYYAQSISHATLALNHMNGLEDDYDVFIAAISGTGWSPSTSPPSS